MGCEQDEMGRLGSQNLLVLLDLFYSPWSIMVYPFVDMPLEVLS